MLNEAPLVSQEYWLSCSWGLLVLVVVGFSGMVQGSGPSRQNHVTKALNPKP